MKRQLPFREPLIQRLAILFLILGLIPTFLLAIVPTLYILVHNTEPVGQSLLVMWAGQGIMFLVVVLIGATITFRRLAMPIQELVKGARAIAKGNLSYRVPIRQGEHELITLSQTFNAMAEAVETMRDSIEKQRAALQTALNEREREFEVIMQIASLVNNQADLPSTAKRALHIARSFLGTDTISLALLDGASDQVSLTVCTCKDCPVDHLQRCDECPKQQLLRRCLHRMQDNLLQRAIVSREKLRVNDTHIPDTNLDPEVIKCLDDLNVRKLAIKPLVTHGRVLGVLVLMRQHSVEIPERAATLLDTLAENIAVLIENWNLQNKARSLTIMEERRRLASELHDSVTQSLFTLSLTARGLKSLLEHAPEIDQHALDVLIEQTKVIQSEMRTLINELRPIDLEADDLESALRQHIQSLRRSTDTAIKLTIRGNPRQLPPPVQQNLNRIAQEALSNIARHACAKHAEITMEITDHMVTLSISDDGIGFDPRAAALSRSGSLGLISMRERAEMLGGALIVRSQPGDGTVLIAQIPLCEESEALNA